MPWEKNFDVDEALERAGETFWSKGYASTSMRDLLQAMGIQKGSFYDTYGSKHEAYMRTLDNYADERLREFHDLTDNLSPRAALTAVFEAIYQDCVGAGGHRGCMVINCALELAPTDPEAQKLVLRSMSRHERLNVDLIRKGQEAGEIASSLDPLTTGKAMLGLVMGMRVYSRAGAPKSTIRALADQALALLDH